jgi:cobalt/nickel transport protein
MKSGSDRDKKNLKKLWIGIAVLVILTPLGLIIPALLGAGGAWGEWTLEEIRKLVGYVPEGMERLSRVWRSPMSNYAVPGQGEGIARHGLGYFLAGLVGVAVTVLIAYLIAKLLEKREK